MSTWFKIEYCEVCKQVLIGDSFFFTFSGLASLELGYALVTMMSKTFGKISHVSEMSLEAQIHFERAAYILDFESPDSQYGKLAKAARAEVEKLKKTFQS